MIKQSGIYAIINKNNGKQYIGSSENIEERWKRHRRLLDRKKHHSRHLQHAWSKYGSDAFDFVILCICEKNELLKYEQHCIDNLKPEYNVSLTAKNVTGVIRSEEYRKKQSASQSGKIISDETRRKISEGMKGKKNSLGAKRVVSDETKRKISETLMGHSVSVETREKIGAKNRQYKHTEEAKRKISQSLIGNNRAAGKAGQSK